MIDRFKLDSNVAEEDGGEETSDVHVDWRSAEIEANVRRLCEVARSASSPRGQGASRKAGLGASSKARVPAG